MDQIMIKRMDQCQSCAVLRMQGNPQFSAALGIGNRDELYIFAEFTPGMLRPEADSAASADQIAHCCRTVAFKDDLGMKPGRQTELIANLSEFSVAGQTDEAFIS